MQTHFLSVVVKNVTVGQKSCWLLCHTGIMFLSEHVSFFKICVLTVNVGRPISQIEQQTSFYN